MTTDQFNRMRQAALLLLARRASGQVCDPYSVEWAEQLLRANPMPKRVDEIEPILRQNPALERRLTTGDKA